MGWTGMKAKYYYKNGMINRKKECDELIEACPDNILDELSEADSDWAKNWRAECRKCNERKQKLSAMPVGSEIKVTCESFEYIMTKTVLPSHSTPMDQF